MRPPPLLLRVYASTLHARRQAAWARPVATQAALLQRIVALYRDTELGRVLGLAGVRTPEDFRRLVPNTDADFYEPLFEQVRQDNPPDLVTAGRLRYLAGSSRTTRASKFIPYPMALIKAFKQFETAVAMHHMHETGNYGLLSGRLLITAGSPKVERTPSGITYGFSSGIMTTLAPKIAEKIVLPTRATLDLTDRTAKIAATVREALPEDVRVVTGMPASVVPLLEALLAAAGRSSAQEVWPNLHVYYWSGSPIADYHARLRRLFGPRIHFREIYASAETSLGFQWRLGEPGLLLDLERTYFEFQPIEADKASPRLPLEALEVGRRYRVLVTTLGGLCAYHMDDVVEVLSLDPPLVKVLGRGMEELNLQGEHLPIWTVRQALAGAVCDNFMVCPLENAAVPTYQFYIEFREGSLDPAALDRALMAHAPYAERRRDGRLGLPVVTPLEPDTILRYIGANRSYGHGKFLHFYADREVPGHVLLGTKPE